MNTTKDILRIKAAVLLAIGGAALCAQDNPTSTSSANEQVVTMTPFTVSDQQVGRYTAAEASAGGRLRVNLMDAPQSISVVTRDLMNDIGSVTINDATIFVPGIEISTIPNDDDRTEIRGFQSEGQTMDGFTSAGQGEFPTAFIDRIEVVKGPDAILAPSSVPGGTINVVSKKPQFSGNSGYASYQVGIYDSNLAELDVNQMLNKNWAIRLVASYHDTKDWVHSPSRNNDFMPSIAYQNSQGLQASFNWVYRDYWEQDYFGYPIDPSSGTLTQGIMLRGVPRNLDYDGDTYRKDRRPADLFFQASDPISDNLSVRVAGHFVRFSYAFTQAIAGGTTGGGVDPYNGDFVPGTVWSSTAPYTPSPAPAFPTTSARSGKGDTPEEQIYGDFQNDYIYDYKTKYFDSQSSFGFGYNYSALNATSNIDTAQPITYTAPTPAVSLSIVNIDFSSSDNTRTQVYFHEKVDFFDGRLTATVGYSDLNYELSTIDYTLGTKYTANVDKGLVNYGVIIKVIPQVSAYFGHTVNSAANSVTSIATGTPPTTDGIQNEGGLRFQLLDKRVFATVCYYHIDQTNFGVTNPLNNEFPIPVPQLPALYEQRVAKGFEAELHVAITPELSLIGNGTTFTNRDPNNIPIRGAAEKSWAGALLYEFPNASPLRGVAASFSANWLGKRPGDQGSGLTALDVPIQPSFYLPPRTLANAMVSYRYNKHWKGQVNIDNVFNTNYIQADLNRFDVWPGPPINVRFTLTYSW